MILAMLDSEWAIAYCYYFPPQPRPPGCALRVRNLSPLAVEGGVFRPNSFGTYWEGSARFTDDLRFFPHLRYNGCQVWPFTWHPTAEEPLLLIEMDPNAKEVYARYGLAWGENHTGLMTMLRNDGWDVVDPRETARKYVHVDDLEKIEGPPPEGPF